MVLSGALSALTHTSHTYDTNQEDTSCRTLLHILSLYSASRPTILFMVDVTIFLSAALRE